MTSMRDMFRVRAVDPVRGLDPAAVPVPDQEVEVGREVEAGADLCLPVLGTASGSIAIVTVNKIWERVELSEGQFASLIPS